jgi:hypothetical protein
MPICTVGHYLLLRDYILQLPIRKACEQCPAEVEHWMPGSYLAINANAEKARIYRSDLKQVAHRIPLAIKSVIFFLFSSEFRNLQRIRRDFR